MSLQSLIPRIVLAVILLGVCIFAYIESTYYQQHSVALGQKAGMVSSWVWVYRVIVAVAAIGCIVVALSILKK